MTSHHTRDDDSRDEKRAIELVTTPDPISTRLETSLNAAVDRITGLSILKKHDTGNRFPYIRLNEQVRWMALPEDKMLPVFLEIVGQTPIKVDVTATDLSIPVYLKVYVAPHCPHCPLVVQKMFDLTRTYPMIYLDIIDAALYEQLSADDQILSVPTVVCDRKTRLTGSVTEREVLDVIFNRAPSEFSPDSLQTMIGSGNAEKLARMMVEDNIIYPAFYDLLTHEKWPVRLGAMVTIETIMEHSPDLAEQAIDFLWERMDQVSPSVKGDLIYLAGVAGGIAYRDKLVTLRGQIGDPELKNSVDDALESFENRFGSGS